MANVTGVRVGSSGLFIASLVPLDGQLQSGPVFTTSFDKVTLQPTNNPFVVVAKVQADNTATHFDLIITGRTSAGEVKNVFVIPILKGAVA